VHALCRSALDALGVPEVALGAEVIKINGIKTYITCSDSVQVPCQLSDGSTIYQSGHFVGLNVLGMDFLAKGDLKLTVDMGALRATILP